MSLLFSFDLIFFGRGIWAQHTAVLPALWPDLADGCEKLSGQI